MPPIRSATAPTPFTTTARTSPATKPAAPKIAGIPMSAPNLPAEPVKTRDHVVKRENSARWNHYRPRDGDVVISTHAKCGTTWMQRIVGMLRAMGEVETREILAEQQRIEVRCEFCNLAYVFDQQAVDAMFHAPH